MTAAAHKVEESDGLSHDERMALRDDVERVRDVLAGSDIAANGTRAVAVYACGPEDLLEVVRLRRPVENSVVLDRTRVRRAARDAGHRRALDGAAHQPPRRAAVLRPRRRARGDRPDRRRRALPARPGRLVAANYQRSVEKEVSDHLAHAAELAFDLYKKRGADRVLIGAPDELLAEFKGKLHPYLTRADRGQDLASTSRTRRSTTCARPPARRSRRTSRALRARGARPAGRRASAAAAAARRDRRGARRAQPGARGDAADRRELPRRRARGLPGRAAAARRTATQGEPVDDIVEPAIEKAIEQSANAMVVRHHDDLVPLGGIGAVLRF